MSEFLIDWERTERTGVAEAVLCAAKSTTQITAIAEQAYGLGKRLLFTHLRKSRFNRLNDTLRTALDYDPLSRTAILGAPLPLAVARVAIVCAGTSDLPIAREAERTLAFHGEAATLITDVGVAGLWRLLDRIEEIRRHQAVIAIAGMEGALFSVIAGLVRSPVVAVPSSVGYGVSAHGGTALHAALSSCAPGLVTVNIDNGFGAALAVLRMIGVERNITETLL